jgi:hypothetical protein
VSAKASFSLVAAYGTRLAGKYVCAGTDGRALKQAAACEGSGTSTDGTATDRLFAKGVAASCKACTGCEGENDVLE